MKSTWSAMKFVPLVAVLGLGACVSAEDDAQTEGENFIGHMHSHLDEVSELKAAVIAGDLDAAREPATWLAEHDEPSGMPAAWATYIEAMRAQASIAANAQDLESAATAVSEIAKSCGDCHVANGFSVAFGFDQRPPEDPQNLMTQMQRHLWAADRMWDGLIGPSDNAWKWGTEMLAEVKLSGEQITDDPAKAQQAEDLVQQAREVGNSGSTAPAGQARSTMYGKFLSLCASCHALTGGGPGTT